jgi:hypothetical protein
MFPADRPTTAAGAGARRRRLAAGAGLLDAAQLCQCCTSVCRRNPAQQQIRILPDEFGASPGHQRYRSPGEWSLGGRDVPPGSQGYSLASGRRAQTWPWRWWTTLRARELVAVAPARTNSWRMPEQPGLSGFVQHHQTAALRGLPVRLELVRKLRTASQNTFRRRRSARSAFRSRPHRAY